MVQAPMRVFKRSWKGEKLPALQCFLKNGKGDPVLYTCLFLRNVLHLQAILLLQRGEWQVLILQVQAYCSSSI